MTLKKLIDKKINFTIDADSFTDSVALFECLDSCGVVWASGDAPVPSENATWCFENSGQCSLTVRHTSDFGPFITRGTRALHETCEPYINMPNYNFKDLQDAETFDMNSFEKILLD